MNKPIPTLAVLALLPILALLALAVACGAPAATAPTPAPLPTYTPYPTATPRPTYTPYPTVAPTAAPTPTPEPTATPTPSAIPQPGIGVTREKIENRFRRAGLEFEDAWLSDGQDRTIANPDDISLIIELIGPSENLTKANIAYDIPSEREAAFFNIAAFLAFLEETFPEWPEADDWVSSALGEMNGDGERSTTRGNKILTVRDSRDSLGLILITVEAK